jgi:hypothetical protein
MTVFLSELLGSLKIHDFPQGADWPAGKPSNLVQRRLGGFGGWGVSSHAKTGARRDSDVNRDT